MQSSKGQSKDKASKKEAEAIEEKKSSGLICYDMQGKIVDEIPSIFNGKVNLAVLSQAVKMYLANNRLGLAATKTRGEVSGGGKKPWRQKGTGRARAGSIRSPLWRHGGVVFGPHPKDFHYQLSKKIRNSALISALNEKAAKDAILILDKIEIAKAKTKEIKKILDNLKADGKTIIVFARYDKNVQIASRNIPDLTLALADSVNALDVLKNKKIIFLKDAFKIVASRINLEAASVKESKKN